MKCVILQPSYVPWRGYFHQVQKADVFVFYDDVQYDRRGWRNRNRVKTPQGPRWLTVPVLSKDVQRLQTPIKDIPICWDRAWNADHWSTLRQAYARAPHFDRYARLLERYYLSRPLLLADFTIDLTIALAAALGIADTKFVRSSCLGNGSGSKTDRLLGILAAVGATHYISGPAARGYIDEQKLQDAGITLEYMGYDYPEYEQLYPPYDPQVSILDLLFMTGERAPDYIWRC